MNPPVITSYAPHVYRSLNGILLVHKPAQLSAKQLASELRHRISESLNQLQPRPLSTRLVVQDDQENGTKSLIEVPNLADHPLVVGPRYLPWELSMTTVKPLSYRSSGLSIMLLGSANKYFARKMRLANLVSVYQITGRFGYVTDNFFSDGHITDKSTFRHIRTGKLDSALSRIEATQHERLFDSAAVPLDSEEAYQLAKAWPSRPPRMAKWPVIYRIRCIHLNVPEFKLEVTVANETDKFLAHLCHDVGLMLKSGACTESIRRVKLGPFDINESLVDKEWDLQSLINHLKIYNNKHRELFQMLRHHRHAMSIKPEHQSEGSDRHLATSSLSI